MAAACHFIAPMCRGSCHACCAHASPTIWWRVYARPCTLSKRNDVTGCHARLSYSAASLAHPSVQLVASARGAVRGSVALRKHASPLFGVAARAQASHRPCDHHHHQSRTETRTGQSNFKESTGALLYRTAHRTYGAGCELVFTFRSR